MKLEDIHIKDIVKFKTRLLNKNVEDIGIVKEINEEFEDWFITVIPFNLKVSELLLRPSKIRRKIGEYSNFDFTNDESNHSHRIGDEINLRLSDDFFKKYIKEISYAYWDTYKEMKSSFKNLVSIKCRISCYWGPHMYHLTNDIHDLRLTDEFIKEFSI